MSRKSPPTKPKSIGAWVWLAILGLTVVIAYFGNDRFWLATGIASVPSLIFVAITILGFGWAWWKRRLRAAWLPYAICLPLHWVHSGFCFSMPQSGEIESYKVMTWNIHHGSFGMERVIEVIRRENPDVVVLQEVQPESGGVSLVGKITRALPNFDSIGEQETAILSRHGFRRSEIHELELASHRRWVADATVELGGEEVRFFSIHLLNGVKPEWFSRPASFAVFSDNAENERWKQINKFQRLLPKEGHVVIGGDFNTIPLGGMYKRFAKYYQDSFAESGRGLGFTYPGKLPSFRIDYLWTSSDIHVRDSACVSTDASDHLPVVSWIVPKKL